MFRYQATAVGADISKATEVAQLFDKAELAFGEITVVVNSAGIMLLAAIQKGDIDNFDKVIATNLRGSYLVMSEAANHVVVGGRIIVFSSSVLGKSFPSYGAYIASKAGVEGGVVVQQHSKPRIFQQVGGAITRVPPDATRLTRKQGPAQFFGKQPHTK